MGSHGLQFVFLYILKKFNYWIKRWNNKMYKIHKIVGAPVGVESRSVSSNIGGSWLE
jgi:hypothetical protein